MMVGVCERLESKKMVVDVRMAGQGCLGGCLSNMTMQDADGR